MPGRKRLVDWVKLDGMTLEFNRPVTAIHPEDDSIRYKLTHGRMEWDMRSGYYHCYLSGGMPSNMRYKQIFSPEVLEYEGWLIFKDLPEYIEQTWEEKFIEMLADAEREAKRQKPLLD